MAALDEYIISHVVAIVVPVVVAIGLAIYWLDRSASRHNRGGD